MAFRSHRRYLTMLAASALGSLVSGALACQSGLGKRTLECAAGVCQPVTATSVSLLDERAAVVDFSRDANGRFPRNGFLLSLASLEVRDPQYDSMRSALDIGTWRVGRISEAQTALAIGARPTLLIYEAWRDQFPRRTPTSWPFDDYSAFESWLRSLVRANRSLPVVWEAWNEWDTGLPWWGGTEDQLLETFALIERVVREEVGPHAEVAGPSFVRFDTLRLRRFADHCVRVGCQVNTWTWHELASGRSAEVAQHARWVRAAFVDDPAYRMLQIRRLDVNEVIAQAERYSPAALVTTLRALHDGGVDAFGRSCWRERRSREYECINASFDGIVDPAARAPRTTWWVHAAYARIREAPVEVTASGPVAVLAGRGSGDKGPALILVAPTDASRWAQSVTVELRGLHSSGVPGDGRGGRRIVVRRLGWQSLDAPVASLEPEWSVDVEPDLNTIRVKLQMPSLGRIQGPDGETILGRDAFLISVEPPPVAVDGSLWPVAARRTKPDR